MGVVYFSGSLLERLEPMKTVSYMFSQSMARGVESVISVLLSTRSCPKGVPLHHMDLPLDPPLDSHSQTHMRHDKQKDQKLKLTNLHALDACLIYFLDAPRMY